MITAHLVVGMVEGPTGADGIGYVYVIANAEQAESFKRMAHPNVTKSNVIEWQIIPTMVYTSAAEALHLHQEEIKDDE